MILASIPLSCISIYQVINLQLRIGFTVEDRVVRQPLVRSNTNTLTVAYFPFRTSNDHIPSKWKTPLYEWRIVAQWGLQERTTGEIPGFVHSIKERLSAMNQSPCLLSQHYKVKSVDVSKPHTSSILVCTQLLPAHTMDLFSSYFCPHQYLAKVKLMASHIAFGSLNKLMK